MTVSLFPEHARRCAESLFPSANDWPEVDAACVCDVCDDTGVVPVSGTDFAPCPVCAPGRVRVWSFGPEGEPLPPGLFR